MVLTYGAGPDPFETAESLLADGVNPEMLFVVHNPDGTGACPAVPRGVTLTRLPVNIGYAGGMNTGVDLARRAGARWVLIATHDARLEPGGLTALLDAAIGDERAGALGPRLVSRADGSLHSVGGRVLGPGLLAHERDESDAPLGPIVDRPWLDGSMLLLSMEALDAVGGFDERFFMYMEDAELCMRMRRNGWRVAVLPAAVAVTAPGDGRRAAAYEYLATRNGLEMARMDGGLPSLARALALRLGATYRMVPKPGGARARRPGAVRHGLRRAGGSLRGVVDFARRRWGPPPSRLLRASDIRSV